MQTLNSNFKFTDINFSEKDGRKITRNRINNSKTIQSLNPGKLFENEKEIKKTSIPKLNLNKLK